jgi:Dyp-type peroxidase family
MVNEGINERKEIHALVVVACDTAEITEAYSNLLMSRLPEGVHKLAIETGRMWRNAQNQPIEHFGYVDGASSPVFLLQDMEGKQNSWKPSLSPLSLVLDRCPAGDANSFGSYLVFRKLEQNPRMFAEMEVELGKALDMSDDEAGALVVGRRKDGTSVMIEPSTSPGSPTNDFDYSADRDGTTCPLHAHARKLNPRGGTLPDDLRKGVEWERPHWIVRRGMPYGTRRDNPAKPALPQDRPGWGKVGLLFMCYQSSIKTQFELLQGKWANDPTFPGEQSGFKGVDPLIGARATSQRREGRVLQEAPLYRSRSGKPVRFHVRSCVRLQGGEYFFVPSISFFRKL